VLRAKLWMALPALIGVTMVLIWTGSRLLAHWGYRGSNQRWTRPRCRRVPSRDGFWQTMTRGSAEQYEKHTSTPGHERVACCINLPHRHV
jgi:hypothetical protein